MIAEIPADVAVDRAAAHRAGGRRPKAVHSRRGDERGWRCAGFAVTMVLLAIVVLCAAPTRAMSQTEIRNEALRAAQIGLFPDFATMPPPEHLGQQLRSHDVGTVTAASPRLSGIRAEPQFVGGTVVAGFAEVVKINYTKVGGPLDDFCSGVLLQDPTSVDIAPVLTAGHCSCGQLSTYKIVRGSVAAQQQKFVLVRLPVRFGGYSCLFPPELQIGSDLALLWITDSKTVDSPDAPQVPMSTPVARIATMHQIYRDTKTRRLVGVGYGWTETGRAPSTTVAAIIPIQSFFCAAGAFAASACASFREFVLADPRAGPGANPADSCGGDSGAPIFWVPPSPTAGAVPSPTAGAAEENPKSVRFLVGITSRALDGVRHNPGTTCGGGGIYTAVGHPDVIRWLAGQNIFVRTKPD
jgi:hypothetical protein